MESRILAGALVEHAGYRWLVERPLGADAVLLRNDAGEFTVASPSTIRHPDQGFSVTPPRAFGELRYTDAEWAEATRRRDLLAELALLPSRTLADADHVARELGLKRRRVFTLLRLAQAGCPVEHYLPIRPVMRTKRLSAPVEAAITHAIRQHYAQANRPSVQSLHREIVEKCRVAGVIAPSVRAVLARVRATDQMWLTRRRQGPSAARAQRLLTGAHPGTQAPWQRVQIDSTPCDIRLVREDDRTVIGRPTVTFAIDLFSRTALGFSVSLEAASTVTVATCFAHACLPKDNWLAVRDLSRVHWPVWGRPGVLEYDQGPENEARGIQRGLRRYGIQSKVRAKGHPEQHGAIERLIGTMMRVVHELPGTTWSNVGERGKSKPDAQACLSLPELERVLALAIDSYNHSTHAATGERPIDRYLAYYRRPGLPDSERVPPQLPADRLLLDFLPFELRTLRRTGVALFRVDYSSVDLLPLWRRDNQSPTERVVVYDPRSLARIWVLDETVDEYLAVPYRAPHPDMTLAQSGDARRRMQTLRASDRTSRRLFENLAEIRSIEAQARTVTTRRKAERTQQALQAAQGQPRSRRARPEQVGDLGRQSGQTGGPDRTNGDAHSASVLPAWTGRVLVPFTDVERL